MLCRRYQSNFPKPLKETYQPNIPVHLQTYVFEAFKWSFLRDHLTQRNKYLTNSHRVNTLLSKHKKTTRLQHCSTASPDIVPILHLWQIWSHCLNSKQSHEFLLFYPVKLQGELKMIGSPQFWNSSLTSKTKLQWRHF